MSDKRVRRLFCLMFVFLCVFFQAAQTARAQLATNSSGTGGRNTIQGSIFLPNGNRSGDGTINVRLESSSFSALSVVVDRNGGFAFTNLTPGGYTLIVDAGEGFQIARESVYIDESVSMSDVNPSSAGGSQIRTIPSMPRTVRVPIYLQLKRGAPVNNAILNAKLADVPKDALKHYEKGIEFAQIGKSLDAVAELKLAVAAYSQFPLALAELGKQYLRLGNLNEAIVALRSSVSLDAAYFDAKLDYGIALLNKKEMDAAEKQLKDAAQINAAAVTPHYYLGLVFIEKQNLDEAKRELELGKKLSGDKGYPQINRLLSAVYFGLSKIYFDKKQYGLAANELEKFLQITPDVKNAEKIRQVIKDLRIKS